MATVERINPQEVIEDLARDRISTDEADRALRSLLRDAKQRDLLEILVQALSQRVRGMNR